MPITSVNRDPEALTMTVVADFDSPLRRLWDAYLDPRQLERFWGPPTYPATFSRHDGCVGGRSEYAMTGPEGDISRGYWEWIAIDPLKRFEVGDGFANADGSTNDAMPSMRMEFDFESVGAGSRVTTTTHFGSIEQLEQLLGMGMEEGMTAAMGQMEAVLADLSSFAAEVGTQVQILGDTTVRVSRIIRGDVETVWRAHNEAALVQQWMLGPDGWTMPVCEIAAEVGDTYRYEWDQEGGDGHFGFTGTLLESIPPHRAVTTEAMIGTEGPTVRNELTLTPVDGGTLVSLLITYPDADVRDAILGTGMVDGMETSYSRMESVIS